MGRPPTSRIKERKKVNFYLKKEVDRLIEQRHIEVQSRLGHRVDKVLFQEALVKTGLGRTDEVVEFLRQDVKSSG